MTPPESWNNSQSNTAVVLGATGQLGSFLCELLLSKGHKVVAGVRRTSTPSTSRLSHLLNNASLELTPCDITDALAVQHLLLRARPRYVFNLAAQSFVKTSFDEPDHTAHCTYLGAIHVLEAARLLKMQGDDCRVYQASSSEMYGSAWTKIEKGGMRLDVSHRPPNSEETSQGVFQDEDTPFLPNSPYAIAKLAAHHAVRLYRKSYGVFASAGIVFNTESERRGEEFVTRKVTRYVGRLVAALKRGVPLPPLRLGNLSAYRDWSFAGDTARAIYDILRHHQPDDFCIASGHAYSIRDWVEAAFRAAGLPDWQDYVTGDSPEHLRPCEVPFLRGRPAKAAHFIGWQPRVDFHGLVRRMVAADIALAEKEWE